MNHHVAVRNIIISVSFIIQNTIVSCMCPRFSYNYMDAHQIINMDVQSLQLKHIVVCSLFKYVHIV